MTAVAEELPKPTFENTFYFTPLYEPFNKGDTHAEAVQQAQELLNVCGPQRLYARLGFGMIQGDNGMALSEIVQRAQDAGIVLSFVDSSYLNYCLRQVPTFEAIVRSDRRNAMWREDGDVEGSGEGYCYTGEREYPQGNNALVASSSRLATPVVDARFDHYTALASNIAVAMADHPYTVITLNGPNEVAMSEYPFEWGDYGPYCIAEFRDWLRHRGVYDVDTGAYAGQGAPESVVGAYRSIAGQPRSQFYDDPSPADASGTGASFNEYFLSDPIGGLGAEVYDFVAHFGEAISSNSPDTRIDDFTCGWVTQSGIYQSPPLGGSPAEAELSYPGVSLPTVVADEKLYLLFELGIDDGASTAQPFDGVTFSVEVDGSQVFSEACDVQTWGPRAVDITAWNGGTREISLFVDRGDNSVYDWPVWGRPRVAQLTDNEVDRLLTYMPPIRREFAENVYNLTDHFGEATNSDSPDTQMGTFYSGGEPRAAIYQVPPLLGDPSEAGLFYPPVDLPTLGAGEELYLVFELGIRDGASLDPPFDGVTFSVDVDGSRVFSEDYAQQVWVRRLVNITAYGGSSPVISLHTDRMANSVYDWPLWGEPRVMRLTADEAAALLGDVDRWYPLLRSRPREFTSFSSWKLRYWDLDDYPGTLAWDVDPLPQSGTGYTSGGFDAPRVVVRGDPYADAWDVPNTPGLGFRQTLMYNWLYDTQTHYVDAGIPDGRAFEHSIAVEFLVSGEDMPGQTASPNRLFTSASPMWVADNEIGSLGLSVVGSQGSDEDLFIQASGLNQNWGIFQYWPYPMVEPTRAQVELTLDLIYDYRVHVIHYIWWDMAAEDGGWGYGAATEMTGAVRDFIADLPEQPYYNTQVVTYSPPSVKGVAADVADQVTLSWSQLMWQDVPYATWSLWRDFQGGYFRVYRSTSAGNWGDLLGQTSAFEFTDASVTPGTTYYYRVVGVRTSPTIIESETADPLQVTVEWRTGDLNCDGAIDNFDIDAFVLALMSTPPDYAQYYSEYPGCDHTLADCSGDGVVDNFDIDPFVDLLTGG